MALLLMLFAIPAIFTSCGDDDKDKGLNDDTTYYDFSVVWDVVDKGDYTTADAKRIAADFTDDDTDLFIAYTTAEAVREFNEYCQRLRYGLSTGYLKITLRATLVRNEGNKTITSKTFYIKPEGTEVKAPGKYGKTIKNDVIIK